MKRYFDKQINTIVRVLLFVSVLIALSSCGEPRSREYQYLTDSYMINPVMGDDNNIMFDTYEDVKFNSHGYPISVVRYKLRSSTEHIIDSESDAYHLDTVWIIYKRVHVLSAIDADSLYHALKSTEEYSENLMLNE